MSVHRLYMLLITVALTFNVACDGDETVTMDGGADSPAGVDTPGGTPGGAPPGGMDMPGGAGGADMPGGTPPGGTEMPGGMNMPGGMDMPGGDTPGGVEFEERMGLGNTAPLSCDGEYCPSARLSGLSLPANRDAATEAGCQLQGKENGATLGALLGFIPGGGDLNSFVNPDENGDIALLLLNHLAGWGAEETGNDAGEMIANFYVGADVDGATYIDPVSFNEANEPLISFANTTVTDGLMRTPESSFSLSLPVLEGLELALSLEKASLVGDLTVDDVGFGMTDGVLGGYLTKESLAVLLEGFYAACGVGREPVGTPPEFCAQVQGFGLITGNVEADILSLTGFVPFDTIVEDAGTSACTDDRAADCNAISLCLLVEMTPVTIRGISD